MENKVIIYTSSTCPYCDMAKDYFKENGIEYEEKNTSEKENRQKLLDMGIRAVPVIFYNDKHVVGFNPEEVEELIGKVSDSAEEVAEAETENEVEADETKNEVKVEESDKENDKEADFDFENSNENEELRRNDEMKKYVCVVCGYVYDPAIGDEDNGIKPGTSFEALPEDWVCPACGVGKDQFEVEE